jgi:hypothetical protein
MSQRSLNVLRLAVPEISEYPNSCPTLVFHATHDHAEKVQRRALLLQSALRQQWFRMSRWFALLGFEWNFWVNLLVMTDGMERVSISALYQPIAIIIRFFAAPSILWLFVFEFIFAARTCHKTSGWQHIDNGRMGTSWPASCHARCEHRGIFTLNSADFVALFLHSQKRTSAVPSMQVTLAAACAWVFVLMWTRSDG